MLNRQQMREREIYAASTRKGFTSEQAGSLLIAVQMRYAALAELKKYELSQVKLSIEKRSSAIFEKSQKVLSLRKRQGKLRQRRDKYAPASGKAQTKRYVGVLVQLREIDAELSFCKNWIAQKERVLRAKHGKLGALQREIDSKRYSLCFGSRKLLNQRPAAHNADTTPFESLEQWRDQWDNARNGQWWTVGCTKKPSGNAEVQWLPESRQLRLRLTRSSP
jgi:hypothetical protein